jgi:hypothetical protein
VISTMQTAQSYALFILLTGFPGEGRLLKNKLPTNGIMTSFGLPDPDVAEKATLEELAEPYRPILPWTLREWLRKGLISVGDLPILSWWQPATGRRLMKVEHRYTLGAALFMVLTSAAYLLLAGR